MLKVTVAKHLIEKGFATGNFTEGRLTVVEGVPPGSLLATIGQTEGGDLELYFLAPGETVKSEVRAVEIVLRSDKL